MKKITLINYLENLNRVSKWDKAVRDDAIDLLDNIDSDIILSIDKSILLNGASNWSQYSYGGCALIYDEDIAKHYCTPSAYKASKQGRYNPNKNETWLDVQARALHQACCLLIKSYNNCLKAMP